MQSDRHAALIARDPRDSKALFAQSWRRVDFSRSRPERSSASVDFAEDRTWRWRPRNAAGICSLGLLRIVMADEDVEDTPDLSISPVLLHHRQSARIRRQGCRD